MNETMFGGYVVTLDCNEELTLLQYNSQFETSLLKWTFENIVRKGEIAVNQQFLLFSQCFFNSEHCSFLF